MLPVERFERCDASGRGFTVPKIVDHEERRAEYVGALWRLVSREGAGAISVRALAAEAGVSPSNVVHYLPSRAAMLAAAVRQLLAESRDRVAAIERRHPDVDLETATDLVLVAIPDSPKRRRQTEVWLLLLAEREVSSDAAEVLVELQREVRDGIREGIDLLAEAGMLAPGRDRDLEAARLHALVDGLSLQTMIDHRAVPPARLRAIVRAHLGDLAEPAS